MFWRQQKQINNDNKECQLTQAEMQNTEILRTDEQQTHVALFEIRIHFFFPTLLTLKKNQ